MGDPRADDSRSSLLSSPPHPQARSPSRSTATRTSTSSSVRMGSSPSGALEAPSQTASSNKSSTCRPCHLSQHRSPPSSPSERFQAFTSVLSTDALSTSLSLNGATAPAIGSSSHSPSQSIPPADTSTASFASSPSSFSFKEISPDLAELLDELRADQRRVLQREFQSVGAGFAERLLSGGARLMGAAEPKE